MHFDVAGKRSQGALRGTLPLWISAVLTCACKFGTADIHIGFDVGVSGDGGQPGAAVDLPCTTPWGMPEPLSELNTEAVDCGGQISPDGLIYYFDSVASGSSDLYVARRADSGSPFSAATAIPELNTGSTEADPVTTLDELEIYFTSDRDNGQCIYRALRSSVASPWGPALRLDALCESPVVGPYISGDGLSLYYNKIESAGFLGSVFVTSRASREVEFAAGTPIPGLALGDTAFGYPSLSPDLLTIYVTGSATQLDLWQATRPDLGAEFGAPAPIEELNTQWLDGDASITADGSQLFFASGRSGAGDFYVAKRSCPAPVAGP